MTWALLIWSASSARRAHSVVGVLALASAATVVPHDPAPITATLISAERRHEPEWYAVRLVSLVSAAVDAACWYRSSRSMPPSAGSPTGCRRPTASGLARVDGRTRARRRRTAARVRRLRRRRGRRVGGGARRARVVGARARPQRRDRPRRRHDRGQGHRSRRRRPRRPAAGRRRSPTLARAGHVVLVPDRRRDGTNVLSRPTAITHPRRLRRRQLRPPPGGGARQSGVPVSVRRDPRLAIDVDTIADCRHPDVRAAVADGIAAERAV